jgi:hypothetical protein
MLEKMEKSTVRLSSRSDELCLSHEKIRKLDENKGNAYGWTDNKYKNSPIKMTPPNETIN